MFQHQKKAYEAIKSGSLEKLKTVVQAHPVFLERSFDPDEDGLLQVAARHDKVDCLAWLLEAGGDINSRGMNGKTPLMAAATVQNIESIKFLLSAGAAVDLADAFGQTALIAVAQHPNGSIVECAKLLIDAGASLDFMDKRGLTALMLAIRSNQADFVKLLIKSGCQIDLAGKGGWTALMYASAGGYLDLVRIFIKAGANPTLKDRYGRTAYDQAVDSGEDATADYLKTIIEKHQLSQAAQLTGFQLCEPAMMGF